MAMEFPEPYHSLPIRQWRARMKATPDTYATADIRWWLKNRRKWRHRQVEPPWADAPSN
jgi:hypothetical protein